MWVIPYWARSRRHKVSSIELTCEPRVSLHGMHGAANSQRDGRGIGVVCYGTNQMAHGLAGEVIPLDAWRILQESGKPGQKETQVGGSFIRIAKGSPVSSRLSQFLLDLFAIGGQCVHGSLNLLSASAVLLLHPLDPGQRLRVMQPDGLVFHRRQGMYLLRWRHLCGCERGCGGWSLGFGKVAPFSQTLLHQTEDLQGLFAITRMIVDIDGVSSSPSHDAAPERFALTLIAFGVKMISTRSASLSQHDEKFGDEQMPDIMRRKHHRAQGAKTWVMGVPVGVKTLHRIGRSALRQKDWLMVTHRSPARSVLAVPLRADLFQIAREKPHHTGIVSKVDSFDLPPQASLAHHLRLTSHPLVAISSRGEEHDLVQPGSGISQQFEHGLLAARDLPARQHGIEHPVDAGAHIGQFLPQIWFPCSGFGVPEKRGREPSRVLMGLSTNTRLIGCACIGHGLFMQMFPVHEGFRGERIGKSIQAFISHDEVEIAQG